MSRFLACSRLFLAGHPYRVRAFTCLLPSRSRYRLQYVACDGETVPMDEAPKCVRDAVELIKERVKSVVDDDIEFNEVLSTAYMEEQKMSVCHLFYATH